MSYCENINFNNGFGEYVLALLKEAINKANCLATCNDDGSYGCEMWYIDNDGDGFGNPQDGIEVCDGSSPHGRSKDGTDCNDEDDQVYPGAMCDYNTHCPNNVYDNNCECQMTQTPTKWYHDSDGDGYGNDYFVSFESCKEPEGWVSKDGDCDDNNPNIWIGADCGYGYINDDCFCDPDFCANMKTFYEDRDGDGYGNPNVFRDACSAPYGYVEQGAD